MVTGGILVCQNDDVQLPVCLNYDFFFLFAENTKMQ